MLLRIRPEYEWSWPFSFPGSFSKGSCCNRAHALSSYCSGSRLRPLERSGPEQFLYSTALIAGGFQVPSRIDGGSPLGQYRRNIGSLL